MANIVYSTTASAAPGIDLRQLARSAWALFREAIAYPDRTLFALCTDFRRADATLASTPYDNEPAADRAWAARQALADRIAALRPTTEAGRRAKASVAVTLLQDVPAWQRDGEVMFALAAFRAEALV